MNLFYTFAVLLAVAQAPVPATGQTTNQARSKHTNQDHQTANSQPPTPPFVPFPKPDLERATSENNGKNQEAASNKGAVNISELAPVSVPWTWHDRIAWAANLLLTVAGGFGVYYAGRTVQATGKAADAALKQATHTVNAERAWILVDSGKIPDDFEPDLQTIQMMDIRPILTNYGKTPGKIVKLSIRKHIIPSAEKLADTPQYLNVTGTDITLPPNTPLQPMGTMISLGDFVDLRSGKSVLYIYGFVEYLDLAEVTRCSRFCYVYLLGGGFSSMKRGFYIATQVPRIYTSNS